MRTKDDDEIASTTSSLFFDSSSVSLNAVQTFPIGIPPSIHHEKSFNALYLPYGTLVDYHADHPPNKSNPDSFFADTPVKSII